MKKESDDVLVMIFGGFMAFTRNPAIRFQKELPGKPLFKWKELINLGHLYGHKTMLHCCGSISILLPLMIKAGLDGIHALQPDCYGMDLSKLKSDPDYVRKETKMVLDIMAPGGGYVAGASHDYILEETPFENILAMFDTISEYRTD